MMVAGFRGTLYRSYEFLPPPAFRSSTNAQCANNRVTSLLLASSGETTDEGGGRVLIPRLPTRLPGLRPRQTTANLRAIGKNFLKLGLK